MSNHTTSATLSLNTEDAAFDAAVAIYRLGNMTSKNVNASLAAASVIAKALGVDLNDATVAAYADEVMSMVRFSEMHRDDVIASMSADMLVAIG